MIYFLFLLCSAYGTQEVTDSVWEKDQESLVLFYASWCGYSQQILPEYERATQDFQDIPAYRIEGSDHYRITEAFGVKGFPQVIYFYKGFPVKYSGERNWKGIREWISRRKNPQVEIETEDKTQLRYVSDPYIDKTFALIIGDMDVAKEVGKLVDGLEIIYRSNSKETLLYKDFDEKRIKYEGEFNFKSLADWIEKEKIPALLPLDKPNLDMLFNKGGKALIALTDKKNRWVESEVKGVGHRLKGKAYLLVADVSTDLGSQLQKILKAPKHLIPVIRLVDARGGTLNITQYQMQDEITSDSIIRFYEKCQKGAVLPYKLSQNIPQNPFENKVMTVVGKNYKELIFDRNKNVFMLFYAPWCTYSQEALPIFDELAFELRDVPNLVFAKINGDLNDVSDENVRGFPTLRLYKAENKTAIPYIGERKKAELKAFLSSHISIQSSVKVDL
ncbi:pdi-2_4 [Blepharisma stoltei]|uniref:Thioredoxin domain-containing protein n=1 Tax=Blepharisma stoltei TaxID=1481888 RepID=A0AAU9K5L4_9CILI|nr:unnamed protein product [Blepharisma stoltei]